MSEKDNANEAAKTDNQSSLNRRRFVKSLGVAGGAAMIGSIGTASASGRGQLKDVEIQILRGDDKQSVVRALRDTSEFTALVREAKDKGSPPKSGLNAIRAGRMSANGRTREIIEVELNNVQQGSGYLLIGRDVDTGDVSVAEVEYDHVARDGTPSEVVKYKLDTDPIGFNTQTVSSSTQKETYDIEEQVRDVGKVIKNNDSVPNDSPSGTGITPQARFGNGPCDECKLLASQVCTVACNGAGGFVCGFFGLLSGGIGGVGCLTIVKAICFFASSYKCSDTTLANKACARVNLC